MAKKKIPKESGEISRREFLKDAGLVVGGAAIGSTVLLAACAPEEVVTTETVTQTQTQTQTATQTTTVAGPTTTATTTAIQEVSRFICPSCGGEFETLALLKDHIDAEHPVEIVGLPKAVGHIVQLEDTTSCAGCGSCEAICGAYHDGAVGPCLQRIWLDRRPFDGYYLVKACLQCDDAPCYYACPYKDEALCIDSATRVRYINSDKCPPGCKLCIEACGALFNPPRINFDPERNAPIMCDLCKDRPEGPACIEFCPAICLVIGKGGEL